MSLCTRHGTNRFFRTGHGHKKTVTIVLSVTFLLLVATGIALLFVEGANSLIGLWHWDIGLAVTVLSVGHFAKHRHILHKGLRNSKVK